MASGSRCVKDWSVSISLYYFQHTIKIICDYNCQKWTSIQNNIFWIKMKSDQGRIRWGIMLTPMWQICEHFIWIIIYSCESSQKNSFERVCIKWPVRSMVFPMAPWCVIIIIHTEGQRRCWCCLVGLHIGNDMHQWFGCPYIPRIRKVHKYSFFI